MPFLGPKLHPDPQQHVRQQRAQAGRQDDRVTWRPAGQEHGGCALGGRRRRLLTQSGQVSSLEEPSFHGEAG